MSDPFIALVNAIAPYQIGRTVDYTDLVALTILPACMQVVQSSEAFSIAWPALRTVLLVPLIALTTLSIMGTSVMQTRQDYSVRRSASSEALRRDAIAEAIATVAIKHGLKCENCASRKDGASYEGSGVRMTYSFVSDQVISFSVQAWPNGFFLGHQVERKLMLYAPL
ncbi:MAG: hypothetical protein LH481_05455 [Burkholderiales bacterium]|nr:hypothetical protein [Burkholderiales bacterium]